MSRALKPQEYYYLYSPGRSVPQEMLKYTFQSLALAGHLAASYKCIYINKNEKRKRSRLFLTLGKNYNPQNTYTHAEQFVLSVFKENEELRSYEIKKLVLDKLEDDIRKFTSEHVYKDIDEMGLCWLRLFLTSAGRTAKKEYTNIIDILETETTELLKTPNVLQTHLTTLDTCIILVDEKVLDILNIEVPNLDEIAAVFEVLTGGTYGGGGYYSGGGGGYSGGGGGFGGFGGGSGGGGSGGSW